MLLSKSMSPFLAKVVVDVVTIQEFTKQSKYMCFYYYFSFKISNLKLIFCWEYLIGCCWLLAYVVVLSYAWSCLIAA